MRERPPLSDGALAATLADGWGVAAASVEFLPVGNDSRAWSSGVVAADGSRRFCKLRRGPELAGLFAAGDVVEAARAADRRLKLS